MQDTSVGSAASAGAWPTIDRAIAWFAVASVVGLLLWFMPVLPGLTETGQHAFAVVLFTVLLWISGAVPTGAAALLMLAIVLCFIPEVKPTDFLSFWTQDTMWFVLVCFAFSAVLQTSGLGKRLTVYVFSIKSLFLIDLALVGLSFLFSALGMNASFPKMSLLFPLVTSVALMSGMEKDHPYVRHLALMINVLANTTGTLVYSGFTMNPALGPLGGFEVDYNSWLKWFFVPALVYTLVSFVVIYVLFLPPKGTTLNVEAQREESKKLGPLTTKELKAIGWLGLALVLWAGGPQIGLRTGFAAALVAGLMLMPGIGTMTFNEYIQKTQWNAVFMVMGVLAIGTLGSTGFAGWIWGHILPEHMPSNGMVSLTLISFLVEMLHIPLGSTATTQALAIPSLAAYAPTMGMSNILVAFVTYMTIIGQFFFPYQNAALVVGLGYGLWRPKDILKFGVVMFFLTPLTLGVLLYPWWLFMGWVQ